MQQMLTATVALEDIEDAEGFVRGCLNRFERDAQIKLERDEFDELVLDGLVILYELAERYEPQREGYDQPGRFSGYAAMFLPRRLGDAWHKRAGHRYVTNPDSGKREWHYPKRAVSLDGLRAEAERIGGSLDSRLLDPTKWVPVPAARTA